ncbi:dna mismatch repair protein [Ophiostoma piceae UAMH 11346]|uniref:Dna mismatch repair protein n=1 Tax=Ophiostoma piceae (strain UAMH 11346) TaxID=1262450 RepID=S3C4L7_OPHP1|nr:dna mismatch repair protein [Ophiostoma piceae UAMH 11346]
MSIQRLPGDVAVQIQSSATVTSLSGTVLGLLKNALDADARTVSITVDSTRGGCTVEDDGLGIPPYEFSAEGGLVKRHSRLSYTDAMGYS